MLAIIAGAGIGGLTAAIALRRVGIEAVVYEAADELRPVGKGIWVPTNAMQALERIGLSEPVLQAGWPLERIEVRELSGEVMTAVDLKRVASQFGHTTVSIHRAKLVRVLAEALPADALHLAKRVVGFEQDAAGVTARFADGGLARGDVLIGADGIRSAVREQLFPSVPLRYSGQTCYRGIADLELPAATARSCWEIWGGDARFGFSAIGPKSVYWFAPLTFPADSDFPPALGDWLAERYAAFPSPVPEIVRHTPSEEIIRTDLYDFAPRQPWRLGRVVLLGDAAHAMTPNLGQGGAQAIEDACVLAESLRGGAKIDEAFARYEHSRFPRVRWIANTAWRFGKLAHLRPGFARFLRNWALRLTPDAISRRQLDRVYRLP